MNNLLEISLVSFVVSIVVVCGYLLLKHSLTKNNKVNEVSENELSDEPLLLNLKVQMAKLYEKVGVLERQVSDVKLMVLTVKSHQEDEQANGQNGKNKKQCEKQEVIQPQIEQLKEEEGVFNAYILLSISDGRLVQASSSQTPYYRAWRQGGRLLYEFYCDSQKVKKAINNCSAIIAPFCLKDVKSVELNQAEAIKTVQFGELDSNYEILNKTIIKFK
ncbi:MAG: hypothetical protein ACI30M_04110 [Muribaculaceae bacterium]